MKINEITYWTEQLGLSRPYTIAYQTVDSVENIFVRLTADDGAFGWGVASPAEDVTGESSASCQQALANIEPLLHGADVRHFKRLLREIGESMRGAPAAMAAADMALHDLWAKHLDLPLVEYFGRAHDSLPTSITIGIKSVDESLKDTDEYLGMGFRILKTKIGKSVDEDLECLFKIRERAGKDVLIRVDANQGYNKETFLKFIEKTAPLDLEFVEQPLGASDLESMRSLPESVRQLSAADESLLGVRDALACLQPPRPFGIFNIKLMKCGGIAPGLQIAEIARLSGIDLMWGCMDESIVGIAAALHAALASPATRYLDLDGSLDLARDLVEGGFILKDGLLSLTDRPGLGVTPLQ